MKKMDSVFVDSGAHSLFTEHVIKKGKSKTLSADSYRYYESEEFIAYVDEYARFLKENKAHIEVYANVDVIFNPALTWKVQRYLEVEHGLEPLPVIHHGTDLRWLKRYLMRGYHYIALGGLGQEVTAENYVSWADAAFNIICDTPDRLPVCKVHGFAITSHRLVTRYPWYSVDSTTWLMQAMNGNILLPPWFDGEWSYDKAPIGVTVSDKSPKRSDEGKHLSTFPPEQQKIILAYIEHKGFNLEELSRAGDGYIKRSELNLIYYMDLQDTIPWPRKFEKPKTGGLGL